MRISRKVRISDTLLIGVLLFSEGCVSPSKPRLSVNTQAEALSHFSLGLLAEANGDSAAALEHLETAVRLDPDEETVYTPAVAIALKTGRTNDAMRLAQTIADRHPASLEAQLLQARVCALTDQPDRAEALFRKAWTNFPDNTDAALFLARFYITRDRKEDALEILHSDVFRTNDNTEQLRLLGTLCIDHARNLGDTQEAQNAVLEGTGFLQRALDLNPDDPSLWQQLGFALLAVKKPDEALAALQKARAIVPEDLALARQTFDLLIQTKKYSEAIESCESFAMDTKTEPEPWFQYLAEQMPKDELSQLIRYLENQIREQPQTAVFYYAQLGSLYIGAGDNSSAETVLLKALDHYPNDNRLSMVTGYLHLQQERYDEAYTELEQVRTGSPQEEWLNNPFFLFNFLAAAQKSSHLEEAAATLSTAYTNDPVVLNQYILFLLTGKSPASPDNAIELLNRFHALKPESSEALYYLMTLQAEQKNYAEAIQSAQQFEALAEKNGDTNLLSGQFYYQYASLYERSGELENAEKLFLKAIDIGEAPVAAAARNYIAYMWAERGEKLGSGLVLIQKALAVEPDNGAFLDTLGWIYYMQGRYAEALTELQKAKDAYGDDPEVWEHLGDTWLKLGNLEEASKHWKKALEFNPESQELIDRLKENGITPDERPAAANSPADTTPRP